MSSSGPAVSLANMRRRNDAAAWHVRLRSDRATEADFTAFERWVADPANRAAYDAGDFVDALVANNPALFRAATEGDGAQRPTPRRAIWLAGGLALAAAAAAALILAPPPEPDRWTRYAAPSGQTRLVKLGDGSVIEIDRGTSLQVADNGRVRRVQLASGEAYFAVVHDRKRPFAVEVGAVRIEDVGTEFNVLATSARTVVTVLSGSVTVTPRSRRVGAAGVRLDAGDQYTLEGNGTPVVDRGANLGTATAWRSGHLVYADARLTDVVADLNRYFDRDVRIEGADAMELRFSGVIAIDSEAHVLARLRGLLPIDVSEGQEEVVVRHIRKK